MATDDVSALVKKSARMQARNAIRRGEIERPDRCSFCSQIGKVHAHHADYDKPLNIVWLCASCHGMFHRLERAPTPRKRTREEMMALFKKHTHPFSISINELAKRLGITRGHLSDVLNHHTTPSLTLAFAIQRETRGKVKAADLVKHEQD